jgi:C-terminal processing protease CtpA/Prc
MRRSLMVLAMAAGFVAIPVAAQTPQPRDLDNAAAFARLYGVVRYFYPGDAGAALAWNRFAVHGVRLVRAARTSAELETSLKALFATLGPGIDIGRTLPPAPAPGTPDKTLIAWRYLGAGMDGTTQGTQGPYQGKRTNRAIQVPPGVDGVVVMSQTVPALPLRGKTIRLRGFVRAAAGGAGSGASLWLRVDRPNQQPGFFDNMMDRQVRDPSWREYTIEGPVTDDAASVVFGTLAAGTLTADFDGINLEVKDASGAWTPVAIQDGGFEAPLGGGWMRGGNSKTATVSQPGGQAPEGERFLHIGGVASPPITAEVFDAAPPAPGAHVDVDLGAGLKARVRLALTDAEARGDAKASASIDALKKALETIGDSPEQPDIDTRVGDVVVAWNVFRHFYPYWSEAGVDWNTRLRPQLEIAAAAKSRNAQRDALRLLVADVRDGHGRVNDPRHRVAMGWLPIALEIREQRVVIVASRAPNDAPVGAVVTTIGGVPTDTRLADLMKLSSGTSQWRERRALNEIIGCQPGTPVTLALETSAGARASTLACDTKTPPLEKRPDPVSELSAGVWYVDLSRARMNDITPMLATLAAGKGVVFDLRGYPTDAGFPILAHLLESSEKDRWMHVARFTGPFGQNAGWESMGWDQTPKSPRLSGRIVFLTDGRAISYAESVMGYVRDRRLATIVGATTAGANGNVVSFDVPSGFAISFTGMKVTRHDGSSVFHLLGVEPDIPVAPTIAGLRSGRDEVLERGLAVIEDKQP